MVLALPLFAAGAVWWASRTIQNALVGPLHTFQLASAPTFLTDALAVEKAKEALALDGYDLTRWNPREDRRSTAPDGPLRSTSRETGSTPIAVTSCSSRRKANHPDLALL
jgi:hypothetical protein